MSVLAEAISVVIRVDAIEHRFPGGLEGLRRTVPNQTFCCDGELARVGFMDPADAEAYVAGLGRGAWRRAS
jgi:hypothetical protein